MKYLIAIITLISSTAGASYVQNSCSNSTGSLRVNAGHSDSGIYVTNWKEDKYQTEELDALEVSIEKLDLHVLEDSNSGTNCGLYWSRKTTVKKISITKNDGTEFDHTYRNLSRDKKTISDFMICKFSVSGMSPPCEN